MSFTQKAIDVTISLGTGSFGTAGQNQVKLSGLRTSVQVQKFAAPGMNTAQVSVYGVGDSVMNQITSLWVPTPDMRNNLITIDAGDAAGMSRVFYGGIRSAQINANSMPSVSLDIFAMTASRWLLQPVPPSSYAGAVDGVQILANLAKLMGLSFENGGVPATILNNQYLPGAAMAQAQECAEAMDVVLAVDDDTLAIWPKDGKRNGGAIPDIGPDTGLVGYPSWDGSNINFRTLFNPALRFGGGVQINSSRKAASGVWYVWKLNHNLQSQTPGGNWFSECQGKRIGL